MKKRLDVYLVENGMAQSRQRAQSVIMSGRVYVDGVKADKSGLQVSDSCTIEVRGSDCKYVSRGGLKLEKAISYFNINLKGCTCMDIGASTGGFADCMLQSGAEKVYCIDVGYGQLAWRLRTDKRVVNLERTNIRYLKTEQIQEKIDFISIDVSFISLQLVLPVVFELLGESGAAVALIKPQFEAGKDKVGKKGVVKDSAVHQDVLRHCIEVAREAGLDCVGISYSPIKGPKGNIEYFIHLKKQMQPLEQLDKTVADVVLKAHSNLEGKAK